MRTSIRRRRRDARRRTQAKRRVYDALLSLEKSGQLVLPPAAPGAAPRTAAPAAAPASAAAAAPPSSSSGAGRRAEERSSGAGRRADERSSDAGHPADGEHESVLLLGEGDFSYALALQRARPRWKIWATTPDSEETIFTEHGLDALEAFAETGDVSFDVDATEPLPPTKATLFEFNYPHTGESNPKPNWALVAAVLESLRAALAAGKARGRREARVTLCARGPDAFAGDCRDLAPKGLRFVGAFEATSPGPGYAHAPAGRCPATWRFEASAKPDAPLPPWLAAAIDETQREGA